MTKELYERMKKDFAEIRQRSMVDGVLWRAAYTEEDQAVKEYLSKRMIEAGFQVGHDAVGNLLATFPGSQPGRSILIGSHLDTVKNGGQYDGLFGVLAGMYAVEALAKEYGPPQRTIQVIGFMEEEGSRFFNGYIGSRALVGSLADADFNELDQAGITLRQAMEEAGYDPDLWRAAIRHDIEAYYEVHIEQGPVLESREKQIGLVESINGIVVLRVVILGQQDHAGTTPMHLRKDALLHASKMIANMDLWATETEGDPTVTVGELRVRPGSSNVVPDYVEFSVDIRSSQIEGIQGILTKVEEAANTIRARGMDVRIERIAEEPPVQLDENLINENEAVCRQFGFNWMRMNSGAGHDAQILAPSLPSALLFVPCVNGRSHTPEEAMTQEAMMDGVEILSRILCEKAWLEVSD